MRLIPRFLRRTEARGINATEGAVEALFGGTAAGTSVNSLSAFGLPAVAACVRCLSESIASLPLFVFERTGDGKRKATEHSLFAALHDSPNRRDSSFEWRQLIVVHVLLHGNSYSYVADGEIVPLMPWRMRVEQKNGELRYIYRLEPGGEKVLSAEDVIHIRGLSFDGITGLSVIAAHRQGLGLALALEEFGASFFGNGSAPGGLLIHPGKLDDKGRKNLRAAFEARHQGTKKAGNFVLLEEGMKWEAVGIPQKDAQFLESRRFSDEQIARVFRVPNHLIGLHGNQPRANVEQESLDFAMHVLRPWAVRIEQELNRKLFGPGSRFFAELELSGLLRGDAVSRSEFYASGITHGWLTRNEARKLENLNALPGLDEPLQPLNMAAASDAKGEAGPEPNPLPASNGRGLPESNGHGRIERITTPGRIWVE